MSDAKARLLAAVVDLTWEQSYGAVTIDAICEQAKVKKGSFYYFFTSKTDLAIAALEADWCAKQPEKDALFSSCVSPVERLRGYCLSVYRCAQHQKRTRGRVLGCLLFNLGCEVCYQDKKLHGKVNELLGRYLKYFETALRDAQAEGSLEAGDPATQARRFFAYVEGSLTQARILDDPEMLKELSVDALRLVGVTAPTSAVALAA